MAQNLKFDPTLKDYVFVNGSPVPSDRVLESSYIALMIPQGAWLYGQIGQGSRLYTLVGKKRTSDLEQQYASIAKEAIRSQVVNSGKASDVGLSNISTSKTGTSNEIGVVPAALPLSSQFTFNPV